MHRGAMASRANIARKIPGIVVLTMEASVKCGMSMVSIALVYASQALTKTLHCRAHPRDCANRFSSRAKGASLVEAGQAGDA